MKIPTFIYRTLYGLAKVYWRIRKPKTGGARVVIVAEGQVLLVKHIFTGGWVFPGGGTKSGESPVETAKREVWEEVRVKLVEPIKAGSIFHVTEGKRDTVYVFYELISLKPEVVLDISESTDYRWYSLNEKLPLGPINTKIWELVRSKIDG